MKVITLPVELFYNSGLTNKTRSMLMDWYKKLRYSLDEDLYPNLIMLIASVELEIGHSLSATYCAKRAKEVLSNFSDLEKEALLDIQRERDRWKHG